MNKLFLRINFVNEKENLNHLELICRILEQYNCRSCEVLSAKWTNYYQGKYLILEGAKHSSNVVIRDREILKQIDKLHHFDKDLIFPFVSYYKLYRYVRKNYSHLISTIKKRKKNRVTHSFRYESVKNIDNDEKIRDILHHRSIKSGKFYKHSKGDN